MSVENAAEVLIVGAGPTGLSLAITLRRWGIPVRIVDRAAEPSPVSKALALWSASLEALQGMGVVDKFMAEGQRSMRCASARAIAGWRRWPSAKASIARFRFRCCCPNRAPRRC